MTPTNIEKTILEAVQSVLTPHLQRQFEHKYLVDPGEVEVKCQQTDDPLTKTLVLRILFDHDNQNIQIPNIFMPETMKRQGIGKSAIKTVFETAKSFGYDLYITDLVNSYKTRLLNRGAVLVLQDAVKITDETDLLDRH